MASARPRVISCGLFAALLVISGVAQAQPSGVQVFPLEYFAPSNPADAYDMIRKLPGFELIEVDDEVRGFSGSRGNVLFDGRVPSGKQETLEQALKRIPASSVLRIELLRGGTGSTAAGNYEVVANVIRRPTANRSSSYLAGASHADGIGLRPDFRLEASNQWNDKRLEGAIGLETDIDDESGKGSIVERNVDGEVDRENRDEREVQRTLSADAEYKLPLGGGEAVANLSVARERTRERIETREDSSTSVADERERLWTAEAGAQYSADVGDGELEGIVVHRLGRLRARATEEDESFTEKTRTSESIGRLEYRRGGDRLRLYGSLEAALNRLNGRASLIEGGVPVLIAGSNVKVSERRAEAAVGGTWTAASALLVEPSLRTEISNIRADSDNPSNESFLFLKPRLRVTWDRGSTRVQATVEREAAQLDFDDFVASAELDRDDVLAGAIALRPPATWSVTSTIEQRFWGDGSLSLSLRREWIDDVIDRVVIDQDGEFLDAVGNIGKGVRQIIKAEATIPFARLGLSGVQLRASVTFLKSRVTDPVTGERRIISEDKPLEGTIRLTHDVPGGRWSWGMDSTLAEREREFRFDEVRLERVYTAVGAFVEFRPTSDWRIRIEGENLTSRTLTEERREFDGLRSMAALNSIETRRIRTAPIFAFSVRKSFGSGAD